MSLYPFNTVGSFQGNRYLYVPAITNKFGSYNDFWVQTPTNDTFLYRIIRNDSVYYYWIQNDSAWQQHGDTLDLRNVPEEKQDEIVMENIAGLSIVKNSAGTETFAPGVNYAKGVYRENGNSLVYNGSKQFGKITTTTLQPPQKTVLPPFAPLPKESLTEKTGVYITLDDGYRHEIFHYKGEGPDDPFNHDPYNYFAKTDVGDGRVYFNANEFYYLKTKWAQGETYSHSHNTDVQDKQTYKVPAEFNIFSDPAGTKFYINKFGQRKNLTATDISNLQPSTETNVFGDVKVPDETYRGLPIYRDPDGYKYYIDPRTNQKSYLQHKPDVPSSTSVPWTTITDKATEFQPLIPLGPSNKYQPLIPLGPSSKYQPLIPLGPSSKYQPLIPLNPSTKTTDNSVPWSLIYPSIKTGSSSGGGSIKPRPASNSVKPNSGSNMSPKLSNNLSFKSFSMPRGNGNGNGGGAVAGKRRRVNDTSPSGVDSYVEVGKDYTSKPIYNRDVPADAICTDINIVSDQVRDSVTVATGKQWVGEILEYEFPTVDLLKNITTSNPKQLVPVEEVYDIDCEWMLKTDANFQWNGKPDVGYARNADGSFAYTKQGSTSSSTVRDIVSTTKVGMNELLDDPAPFMLYVCRKNQEKLLGDYIAQNVTDAAGNPKEMTARQFDEFCYDVKPMYAAHFIPVFDVKTSRHFMGVDSSTGREIPEATAPQGFKWAVREFHYNRNMPNLTACDTYSNRLLIGTYCNGAAFGKFYTLTMRIYHKTTQVEYDTLYFMSQHLLQPNSWAGDRHKWGDPQATGIVGDKKVDDYPNMSMTICVQHGRIKLYNDGVTNASGSKTNILQDQSSEGSWY